MKFHKGSSGSPKHTETMGDGKSMGGRPGAPMGPMIGPGKAGARVRPEIGIQVTRAGADGADRSMKGVSIYKEGSAPPKGRK